MLNTNPTCIKKGKHEYCRTVVIMVGPVIMKVQSAKFLLMSTPYLYSSFIFLNVHTVQNLKMGSQPEGVKHQNGFPARMG